MSREKFRSTNFRPETQEKIDRLAQIVAEYGDQKLTSRQVFYQFVSHGWLDNTERSYKMMTSLITDARYAGIVDWEAIEDRGREPINPPEYDSLTELVGAALNSYRLPRWKGQKAYVELWVEKQALAGVLAPIARRHHVTLMVNKGYSSASAMKEAADRFREAQGVNSPEFIAWRDAFNEQGDDYETGSREHDLYIKSGTKWINENTRQAIVLYLGDHDPSGKDMVRDIYDRLTEFNVWRLEVVTLGLTMEQIEQFNPPPNPAKITDSRAKAYIEKYGTSSWELDALPPRELNRIVDTTLKQIINKKMMNAVIAQEDLDKERLRKAVTQIVGAS